MAAFRGEPISEQVFPRTSDAGADFWRKSLDEEINDPHARFWVATDPQAPSSSPPRRIVAFAKWVAPGAPYQEAPGPDGWPRDGDAELAVRFFGALAAGHQGVMGGAPHWYLEVVAVRPEYMGKGLARRFLEWGLARADEDGLPAFLEANAQAQAVYERFGFRVVKMDEISTPRGVVLAPFMLRDARKQT